MTATPVQDDRSVLDTLLSKAVLEKDLAALDALMTLLGTRYYGRLLRSIYGKYDSHTETCQDILQDTFANFMEAVRSGKLKELPGDVLHYVMEQARYLLRYRFRKLESPVLARRHPGLTEFKNTLRDPNARTPVTQIRLQEDERMLETALHLLSEEERRLLDLCRKNLEFPEIARRLGKKEDAVRKNFCHVKEVILRHLAERNPTLAGRIQTYLGRKPRVSFQPPPPEEVRRVCEGLPPNFRDVIVPLHYGGKKFEDIEKALGGEIAAARRDGAYQILSCQFKVDFPEYFEDFQA